MLLFAAPLWLGVSGAAALAGAWALLSGHKRVRGVSSVRLWKGLGEQAGPISRRRWVDPVWLLLFLALVSAGIGLGQPEWQAAEVHRRRQIAVTWALRSLRQAGAPEQTELFVRAAEGAVVPKGSLFLEANDEHRQITADELQRGTTLLLRHARGDVEARLGLSRSTAAMATFERPPAGSRPMGLFKLAGPGLNIDPALARVFAVRPGADEGNAAADDGVVLVNDPAFSLATVPENATLVIAEPQTPLPGLVPGERLTADSAGWKPTAAANRAEDFVQGIVDVRISAMRAAALDATWSILATADGRPWLAARAWSPPGSTRKISLLWLASEPAAETNWPKFASFVVFFGAWTDRALDAGQSAPAPFVNWKQLPDPPPDPPVPARSISGWFAALSALLALAAAWRFLARGRES